MGTVALVDPLSDDNTEVPSVALDRADFRINHRRELSWLRSSRQRADANRGRTTHDRVAQDTYSSPRKDFIWAAPPMRRGNLCLGPPMSCQILDMEYLSRLCAYLPI